MLDKYILRFIEIELPNPRIEVSKLYYERKYGDAPPNTSIDLSFAAILKDLNIPPLAEHDAFNDALMTAMMYVALRDMKERGIRIPRLRTYDCFRSDRRMRIYRDSGTVRRKMGTEQGSFAACRLTLNVTASNNR